MRRRWLIVLFWKPDCRFSVKRTRVIGVRRCWHMWCWTAGVLSLVAKWRSLYSSVGQLKTRSPAVARMANHTAPVVKLTLTLSLILSGPREWDGVSAHATAANRVIIWRKRAVPLKRAHYEEFCYLGSIQSSSGRCYPDLHRRIELASSAMHSMQRCWRQQRLVWAPSCGSTKPAFFRSCCMDPAGRRYTQTTGTVFSHGMLTPVTGCQMAGSYKEYWHSWHDRPAEHYWHN